MCLPRVERPFNKARVFSSPCSSARDATRVRLEAHPSGAAPRRDGGRAWRRRPRALVRRGRRPAVAERRARPVRDRARGCASARRTPRAARRRCRDPLHAYVRVSDERARGARRAACLRGGEDPRRRGGYQRHGRRTGGGRREPIGHITNDTRAELASASRSMDWRSRCALFADVSCASCRRSSLSTTRHERSIRTPPALPRYARPGRVPRRRRAPVGLHSERGRGTALSAVLLTSATGTSPGSGIAARSARLFGGSRSSKSGSTWTRFGSKTARPRHFPAAFGARRRAFLASLDGRRPRSARTPGGRVRAPRDIAGCAEAIETVKRTSGEDTETNAVPREATEVSDRARTRRARRPERTREGRRIRKKNTNPCFSLELRVRRRDQSHRRRVGR